MSAYKPFEKDLHDKYDQRGKLAVSSFLKRRYGFDAVDNPDTYGVDLLVYRNGRLVGNAEVEVRQWNKPYETIHVPERKGKFFNDQTTFFAITQDIRHVYWIKTNKIKEYELKEVKNIKVKDGEMFYDVPTSVFKCETL